MTRNTISRAFVVILAFLFIAFLYIFQRQTSFSFLMALLGGSPGQYHPYVTFVITKTLRLILNDLACMAIIWAIFQEKQYLKMGWYIFLLEILILLPLYFCIKLPLEGDTEISSPLLSHLHRMIVNPTLMILLIFGFVYQRMQGGRSRR